MDGNNVPVFPLYWTSISMTDGAKLELAILLLIYCVGVAGNIVVIFMTLFLDEFKKVTHWYVLQLAMADVVFLQVLPFYMSELITMEPYLSISICRARLGLLYLNYYASILFLTVMAVDRYLAVCHSLSTRVQRLRSHFNAVLLTIFIWILAIGCTIPVFLYSTISPSDCSCIIHFPSSSEDFSLHEGTCGISLSLDSSGSGSDSIDNGMDDVTFLPPGFGVDQTEDSGDGIELNSTNPTNISTADEPESFTAGFPDGYPILQDLPANIPQEELEKLNISDLGDTLAEGCSYDGESIGWHAFLYVNAIVLFFIPLIVISISYYKIIAKLVETTFAGSRKNTPESEVTTRSGCCNFLCPAGTDPSTKASTGKSYREKRRVSVMCASLVFLFLCCWLPFHSVQIAKMVGISAHESFCGILTKVTMFLVYVNSALNPYLYSFMGTCKKRMRQVRSHKRMQTFLSVTGITRFVGRSGTSANNSSETSRAKKASVGEESSVNVKSEKIKLQTFQSEHNGKEMLE